MQSWTKAGKTHGEANLMTSVKETRLYDTDSASNNDNNVTKIIIITLL